jgi:hypothetical protein
MKKATLVLFLALAASGVAIAQRGVPQFRQYPAAVERAKAPGVDFRRSPDARTFRTRLTEAYRRGVNFAGRYIVAGWGCGTGCTNAAIIDTRNGRVYWPSQFAGVDARYGDGYSDRQLDYRRNSRLLIIHGRPGTENENAGEVDSGDYYYEWRNNRLRLIRFIKK